MRYVPPKPFEPQEYVLPAGSHLFRVFSNSRTVDKFNPGGGDPTRFAFFGDPKVPVLYAADTEEAAVCESILHDVPPGPGQILSDSFQDKVCAPLTPTRDLRLASLMGDGLRVLGTEAKHVTGTMSTQYHRTVRWAEAAHAAGFDGLVWVSNKRNTDRTYVFFGDSVLPGDLKALKGPGRIFAAGTGFDWLVDYLAGLGIDVIITGP